MNTLQFCILSLLVIKSFASTDQLWHEWKRAYNKEYNGLDEEHRRTIWNSNVEYINAHNLRHDLGLVTYTLGLNQFTDLTFDEFKSKYLSELPATSDVQELGTPYEADDSAVPTSVDWRSYGLVTSVKNQGNCGSCWAFSTTGSVEGQYKKAFGKLLSFSEQQLVDCSSGYGNYGCSGGLMERAFNYLRANGLEEESDYPYRAVKGFCKYNSKKGRVQVTSYYTVHTGKESQLQALVGQHGPASVAVDVKRDFMMYRSGIYTSVSCSSTALNHAVLAVGYGTERGKDYWIVKNSWGSRWGEGGYIRMARNRKNMCGIATMASLPVVRKLRESN